ncbi:MAG: hypothetical protein E6R04_04440 [Spirochaetes bacterium]|nr:MAG: hypothetical protein E6R04_04440 [Spirochaetota bacterium]
MGFNTPALILNDTIADLKQDPVKFVDSLVRAVSSGGEYPPFEDYSHIVKLLPSFHADNAAVVVAGGNTAAVKHCSSLPLRPSDDDAMVALLHEMSAQYGYKLVPR